MYNNVQVSLWMNNSQFLQDGTKKTWHGSILVGVCTNLNDIAYKIWRMKIYKGAAFGNRNDMQKTD